MRNIIPFALIIGMAVGAVSCSVSEPAEMQDNAGAMGTPSLAETRAPGPSTTASLVPDSQAGSETAADNQADESSDAPRTGSDTLVAYFSATGTTKGVAEKLADILGADTYEIAPAQEYTTDDLNWNNSNSRTTLEQNDPEARPEIGSLPILLDGYTTIYIGYPIWWGEAPRIMDTFVESYDFDGITVIPFCTSGGSGIGQSGTNLAERAGSGDWRSGARLNSIASEEELQSWVDDLQ